MIVMKFGGSSLASPASIDRVVSIIQSQAARKPVVIASAMGDTTDDLLEILSHARRADTYSCLKLQDQVRSRHFAVCEELLQGEQQIVLDQFLRETFRDLHVHMLEVAEGERRFTAELQDWTLSLGEQLSSRVLAAVVRECRGAAAHLDARKLVLTDDHFTAAVPLYWETYARIRWAVPVAAQNGIPVLGGFIGNTADGRTTTLGRGGSDLTGSIVGAALNVEEIQVWKDVDGMLTCDPRILKGGHQVRRMSYDEAAELARAGATILHPDTIAPARRLRIPIVIRNTFFPEGQGTTIEQSSGTPVSQAKSIAARTGVTLLEVRTGLGTSPLEALMQMCAQTDAAASVLCSSEQATYIVVDESSKAFEHNFRVPHCLEVRIRSRQAILTVVGHGVEADDFRKRAEAALQSITHFVIPGAEASNSLRIAVPQDQMPDAIRSLHGSFFAKPDPRLFIASETAKKLATPSSDALIPAANQSRNRFAARPALLQFN